MDNSLTSLALLWILFAVSHSVLAKSGIKNAISSVLRFSPNAYRVFYNLFAFLFLTIILYLQVVIKSTRLFQQTSVSIFISVVFCFGGAIIMLMCVLKYFKQLSGMFKERETPKLETQGLHRYVRHPLYVGTILFVLGLAIYFPLLKNIISALIVITYTLIGAHFEEQKLVKLFGQQYKRYQQDVPMIFPRIGKKNRRQS